MVSKTDQFKRRFCLDKVRADMGKGGQGESGATSGGRRYWLTRYHTLIKETRLELRDEDGRCVRGRLEVGIGWLAGKGSASCPVMSHMMAVGGGLAAGGCRNDTVTEKGDGGGVIWKKSSTF